jgi:hypothetical protein
MGRTKTSKLLATKRPQLFPVYDKVVAKATGIGQSDDFWSTWREWFSKGGESIQQELIGLRADAGVDPGMSLLRVLDVVIWMREKGWRDAHKREDFVGYECSVQPMTRHR